MPEKKREWVFPLITSDRSLHCSPPFVLWVGDSFPSSSSSSPVVFEQRRWQVYVFFIKLYLQLKPSLPQSPSHPISLHFYGHSTDTSDDACACPTWPDHRRARHKFLSPALTDDTVWLLSLLSTKVVSLPPASAKAVRRISLFDSHRRSSHFPILRILPRSNLLLLIVGFTSESGC